MDAPITSFYAGALALLFIWLSMRVIAYRRRHKVSLGDNNDADMERRLRAQGNCMEYAPIGLILLLLLEFNSLPVWALHLSGMSLLLGRTLHAVAFVRRPMNFQFRKTGMLLTLFQITISAIALMILSVI